ncbi:MAG: EF-P lysine aminoacylase GenX [Simkaniaceae bacterium]|nr:EF-P lysine aminoacylase GenX [Simkaniaceae bacterium]
MRSFFSERSILEVDTPLLNRSAALDAFIDVIETDQGYLHTSPEYAMKRLLSLGAPDIYYLGHVFRKEENGRLHHHEFTMIEYYRKGWTLEQLIEETLDLISIFIPNQPVYRLSYDEAFSRYKAPVDSAYLTPQEERHLIWAMHVEPQLQGLTVIDRFPEEEAALAKIIDGKAMRFEMYYHGVELANGYDELSDATLQRERFTQANEKRLSMGKSSYALDELFLNALDHLPPCVGVAIGFDRLLQIQLKAASISDVIYTDASKIAAWPRLI